MIDTVYLEKHNISEFNVKLQDDKYLKFYVLFYDGNKFEFYVEEEFSSINLDQKVKTKIEDYEWKSMLIKRKDKLIKLKME